jgi:hypothetical protein
MMEKRWSKISTSKYQKDYMGSLRLNYDRILNIDTAQRL